MQIIFSRILRNNRYLEYVQIGENSDVKNQEVLTPTITDRCVIIDIIMILFGVLENIMKFKAQILRYNKTCFSTFQTEILEQCMITMLNL